MDSSFVNYDGRSVHDMIEALLAMSGDPEAIRRLQESINAVDQRAQSSIAVVNAAIAQLDEDKQDVGDYTEYVIGDTLKKVKIQGSQYLLQLVNKYSDNPEKNAIFNFSSQTGKIEFREQEDTSQASQVLYTFSADEDTGWTLLDNSANQHINGIYYRRKNGIGFIYIGGPIDIALTANAATVVGTLPTGFRPTSRPMQVAIELNNALGLAIVAETGEVRIKGYVDVPVNSVARGSTSFPV